MSLLGHIAIGVATARVITPTGSPPRLLGTRMLALSALVMLPDLDLLIPATSSSVGEFTHRGASHSLAVALLVGIIIALAIRARGGRRALAWGCLGAAVFASHALLDMFGQTTLGVALFWPISDVRVLAPWRVLPNPPWPGLFSAYGLGLLALEFALFMPFWVYAFVPRRWFGRAVDT